MESKSCKLSRRSALKVLGAAGGGVALASWSRGARALVQGPDRGKPLEIFTGPGANSHWNSVGRYVTEPQKALKIYSGEPQSPPLPSPPEEPGWPPPPAAAFFGFSRASL